MSDVLPDALTIEQAIPIFQQGAALLDVRPKAEHIAMNVPGSVYIPADEIGARIGGMLPPSARLVLLISDHQAISEIAAVLANAGYTDVAGYIDGGIEAWDAAGLPITSGDVEDIDVSQLREMLEHGDPALIVVDVREPWEFRMGRVPNAVLIPLGELPARTGELDPNQPVALICAHGVRSVSAAAVLGRKGFKKMYNVTGGTSDWMNRGFPIERG